MLNKRHKSSFYKEIERRYGANSFEMKNFIDGKIKMRFKKEELNKYYKITMNEFAAEAQMAGFKIIVGYAKNGKDIDDLIIFK